MQRANTFLKLSGLFIILGSLLLIEFPLLLSIFVIIGIYLMTLGTKELNTLYPHSIPIFVLGIIFCFLNVISGILLILAYEDIDRMKRNGIKAPPKKKEKIDPESRKIDILLKLGVAMVFIAGILFATTTWDVITAQVKLIVLLLLAFLFLGLSIFSEQKLKILNTTKMYWLLSMAFFIVSVVGIFYYGVFGNELSYQGTNSDIAYSLSFVASGLISLLTAHKFNINILRYVGYFSIFAAIDFISTLGGELVSNLIGIAYFVFFITMLLVTDKEKSVYIFSKYMLYFFPILVLASIGEVNNYILLTYSILNIIALFIISKQGSILDKVIPYILMFIIILCTIYSFTIPYRELLVIAFTSLIAIINRLKLIEETKANIYTTSIMNAILAFILFIIAIMNSPLEAVLVAFVYLIYNLLSGVNYFKDNTGKLEYYLQPVSILYFVMSVMYFLDTTSLTITFLEFASVLALIYAIMHFCVKNKVHKTEYFVFTISTTLITVLANVIDTDPVASIILTLPLIYVVLYYNNKNNVVRNCTYLVLLFDITCLFILTDTFAISSIINSLILLWIFVILLALLFKDKQLRMINYFAITIPIYFLLRAFSTDYIYYKLLLSILEFYLLYLLLVYLFNNKTLKNIGALIGISLIVLQLLFISNVVIGVYVGIIGISLILLSYLYSDYSSLFWLGLVITIINIIFQLKDLWYQLPFWLYLLVCGLGIIFFVTYKEIKRTKK